MLRRGIEPFGIMCFLLDEGHITWRQATAATCVPELQRRRQMALTSRGKGRKLAISVHPAFNDNSLGEWRESAMKTRLGPLRGKSYVFFNATDCLENAMAIDLRTHIWQE